MHEIGIWFLLISLFVPRITLLFWWMAGQLPYNTTPFIADFFASIFIPRVLILVWIHDAMGICTWFWIHLVVMLLVWGMNMLRFVLAENKSNLFKFKFQ